MPAHGGQAAGDLYVRLVVTLPDKPDAALSSFAEGWTGGLRPPGQDALTDPEMLQVLFCDGKCRLSAGLFRRQMTKVRPTKAGISMAFEGLMKGKRGLIMGVANDRSIAWGIAKALHEAGAELAFSYQGDVFKKRVTPLVEPLKPAALIDCDVSEPGLDRRRLRRTGQGLGQPGFRGPCHRLFRQGAAQGPLCRHHGGKFPHDHGHLLLFLHRGGAARREDDAQWRQPASPSPITAAKKSCRITM